MDMVSTVALPNASNSISRIVLFACFVYSILLYFVAPNGFSHSFCVSCFIVFAISSYITLRNNIARYKTLVLFEVLFILAFCMTNYIYPLCFYESNPYFSIFIYGFNENIISRATAIATTGVCAYNIGQFDNGFKYYNRPHKYAVMRSVTWIDKFLLFVFFLQFFVGNIGNFKSGFSGGANGGFFMIYAVFLVFKTFHNGSSLKDIIINNKFVWSLIVAYILLSLYVGNRGEPLYIIMSVVICYCMFIRKIGIMWFISMIIAGLLLFFVVGEVRVSERDASSVSSLESRISDINDVDNVLMYGEQIIINARSLYVLVDYADTNGINFGSSWIGPICSIVPFLQGLVQDVFGLKAENFSTAELTTILGFGDSNPDAFGLGTNVIGDIFICFGYVGVIIWMYLLGLFVKRLYIGTINKDTASQVLYCCMFIFAVYYTRGAYLTPLRTTTWVYVLYLFNIKNNRL